MKFKLPKGKNGYQFCKNKEGDKENVHRIVAKKKYKMDIPKDFEIHHIDGNKENNQYFNLIMLHKKDHRRIHLKHSLVIRSKRSSEE